jgi:tetratricopeptide (TPR) repeat protein
MPSVRELWRTSYFPVVLTLVIALAVLGLEIKFRQLAVDSVFVALLLIVAGAVVGIRYLDDLMRRVSKIGPGGVELAPLSATDPAASRLLDEQILEWRSAIMLATAIAERDDDNEDEAERTFAYRRAANLLERAKAQDPTDAMIYYQLGWLYDELGRYDAAIAENGRAAELDPEIAPSTFWNTAVSTLKTGDPGGAIAWLYRVPPGRIWREIAEDPELEPLHARPGWVALLEEKLGEPPEHGAAG